MFDKAMSIKENYLYWSIDA